MIEEKSTKEKHKRIQQACNEIKQKLKQEIWKGTQTFNGK